MITIKRRILAGLGAGIAGAALLTACSPSPETPPQGETAETAPADLKAEISYSMWDEAQRPTVEQWVAAFNKTYPNITVNITVTPWDKYFTKLQTQASGGELPDVFWLNSGNFQLYASEGQLQPLGDLKLDMSVFPEALVDTYTYDGAVYAVPKDYDTIGLFYNEALFTKAGVDVPTADWTWDDYHKAAQAISQALKADGVYGSTGDWANQEFVYPLIYSYGGQIITDDGKSGYDGEASQKAFTLLAEMAADGSTPSVAFTAENWGAELLGGGKAAMMPGGNWNAGILKDMEKFDDIRVAPLPRGTQQATVIHGVGHAMSANSKNKDAASAFVRFLATEEAGQIQGASGGAMPAFKGLTDGYVQQFPSMDMQVFVDAATQYAFPMPASRNTAAWMALESEWYPKIIGGEVTVADGTKSLADAMNAALASE